VRQPLMAIGMGSELEGWLSIDLDSLRFTLETENGKRTVETLTLAELRDWFPIIAGLVAGVLAQAVKSNS